MKTLAFLLLSWLAACANPQPDCAPLGSGASYCLQALPTGTSISAQQMVEVRLVQPALRERLLVALDATNADLHLAVLTPMGQTLGHLAWDGKRLDWQGLPQWATLAHGLPALVQVHLWPTASVRAGLRGASLTETDAGRELRGDEGGLLLGLRNAPPPPGSVEIDYPGAGLWLRVEPLGE